MLTLKLAVFCALMSVSALSYSIDYISNIPQIVQIDGENVYTRTSKGMYRWLTAKNKATGNTNPYNVISFPDDPPNVNGTTYWHLSSREELEEINNRIGMKAKGQWALVTAKKKEEQIKAEDKRRMDLVKTCASLTEKNAQSHCIRSVDVEKTSKSAIEPVRSYFRAFAVAGNNIEVKTALLQSADYVARKNRISEALFDQEFQSICVQYASASECEIN